MSMRKAINAMCKACIYDPVGGNGHWREQVEACTSKTCPLYALRPQSSPKRVRKSEIGEGVATHR